MAKESAEAKPKSGPTPKEIVKAWREEFVTALKPWTLDEDENVEDHKNKLEKRIAKLLGEGNKFTEADLKSSLIVARDAAQISKILQPAPHSKKVGSDNLQRVLKVCAKGHMVCRGPGGGGGWCDV